MGWFDGNEVRDHVGVELWADSPSPLNEGVGVMLNVMSTWETGWNLDRVLEVFNIDPNAQIWEQGDE